MIIPKETQNSHMVAQHYDNLDSFYREFWGEHLHHGYWKTGNESLEHAVKQLVELAASRAELSKNQRVCDVGCGYGATARMLADQWKADVTGFTLSQAQYNYAQTVPAVFKKPRFFLRDWLNNQMPSESFDAVLAIESSEHMMDKKRFFNECKRVLAPQGKVVICAWLARENPAAWEERWLLEPICREGRLPHMGTAMEYIAWLQEAGFHSIRFEDISKNVRKTWAICSWSLIKGLASNSRLRQAVRDPSFKDRVFALTVYRLLCAYYIGSMQYGIFSAKA